MLLALDGSDAGVCVNGSTISNLRFADDISLLANSDMDLQQLVNKVDGVSSWFGLTVSSSKTEVQVVGRDVSQVAMHIKLGSGELNQVDKFVYLGGTACSDASCDKDIARRIGIAAGVAWNLEIIWKAKDISKETKVLVYRSLVQSILLSPPRKLRSKNPKVALNLWQKLRKKLR